MRLGQQNRRPCPYFFCSAILTMYVTKRHFEDPDDQLIEMIPNHEIRNDNLRPETCPASLMSLPLDDEMERLLHGMERTHYNQLLEKARRENSEPPRMPFLEPPPPGSQSMLPKPGSHRFGRTPATEEDQPDWALGGRDDEDVQANPQTHPIPPSQLGIPMTGRHGSMSVAGVRALIMAGNAEGQGAHAALSEAKDPNIDAALASVETAMEQYLNHAFGGVENAMNSIAAANEEASDDLATVAYMWSQIHSEALPTIRALLEEAKQKLFAAKASIDATQGEILGAIEAGAEYSDRL